jgi:hypothetical protein
MNPRFRLINALKAGFRSLGVALSVSFQFGGTKAKPLSIPVVKKEKKKKGKPC